MRRFVLIVILLALPSVVQAQTVSTWNLKIFNQGAASPISVTPMAIPKTAATCNLSASGAVPNPQNPNTVWVADPDNAGKFCKYTAVATDFLLAMPITGSPLEASLSACTSTNLCGGDSARVPFGKPGVAPAVPVGFGLQ